MEETLLAYWIIGTSKIEISDFLSAAFDGGEEIFYIYF